MDGAGEYHAKQNKSMPPNGKLNVFYDMQMLILNEEGVREE